MSKHDDFCTPIFDAVARNIFGFVILIVIAGAIILIAATLFVIWPLLLAGGIGLVGYKYAAAQGHFDPPRPELPKPQDWDERHASMETYEIARTIDDSEHVPDYLLEEVYRALPSLVRATHKEHIQTAGGKIIEMFRYVLGPVPLAKHPSPLNVPLHALHMHPLPTMIETLYGTVINQPGFEKITRRLHENVCAVSGVAYHHRLLQESKLVFPSQSDRTGDDLIHAYLKGTPLAKLLTPQVPLTLPDKLLAEHTAMFAPAGHGKTQALQALILGWLQQPNPPAMFIIDSHGDMLRKIERLALFNTTLKDRLVIIDPEDESPPALNFLDFSGNEASVAEIFTYLMSALSSDLSSKQSTVVAFILRLMAAIPNSTIDTLRMVMEDNAKTIATSKFADAIATLDPIAQDFFAKQFYAPGNMSVTKQSVARRIYALLANPVFQRMFSATKNRFNALEAMQQKKIVLINTSMKLLRTDASSVFGRYMIAQILAAAYDRGSIPEKDRHLALLVIDEASQYMDDQIETILAETRKFGLGLFFATQFLEQLPANVKAAVNGTTSIKFAGPVSHGDANALGREMYSSGEFLRSMRKTDTSTQFAVHVKTVTPSAIPVTIPFGLMENAPTMTDAEHAKIRERNRRDFGIAPTVVPKPTTAAAMPRARTTPPPLPRTVHDPSVAGEY